MSGVRTYSRFEELPPECSRIFSPAATRDFFLELPWFRNLASTSLKPDEQIRLYQMETEGLLAARFSTRGDGPLRMRKLLSLSNFYSSFFDMVGEEEVCMRAANEIARAIRAEKPAWDAVEFSPMDPQSSVFAALRNAFESAGFLVQTYFCFGNWYLPVQGRSYAQYVESLPSMLRNTLARKKKKLEKSGRARIEVITGGSGLEDAIAAYEKIYLASWKKPEPFPKFVPGLIRFCAERGWLRLGIIRWDSEPIAAQIWIVHNGVALIYKLAYNERFADLSAGSVLTAKLMEHAVDVDKVHTVDYLTGDDTYKKDWMSHRRERWGILALNPHTLRGALAVIRHFGGRAVKRWMLRVRDKVKGEREQLGNAASSTPRN